MERQKHDKWGEGNCEISGSVTTGVKINQSRERLQLKKKKTDGGEKKKKKVFDGKGATPEKK